MTSDRPSREIAIALFGVLTGTAVLYCLLSGVRSTADCLSVEKREGTLGLLFLTDLKGYDVVLGKLATARNRGHLDGFLPGGQGSPGRRIHGQWRTGHTDRRPDGQPTALDDDVDRDGDERRDGHRVVLHPGVRGLLGLTDHVTPGRLRASRSDARTASEPDWA